MLPHRDPSLVLHSPHRPGLGASPWQGTVAAFSDDETAQLQEVFSLTEAQLELVLSGSAFVFEQAAYSMTPPDALQNALLDAGLAEDHARAFGAVWQARAAECVQTLKERSVLAPQQLTAIDWQLTIATAGSDGARTQRAQSILEFQLSEPTAGVAAEGAGGEGTAGSSSSKAVHVRLGIEQMSGLLKKLDTIQGQLDRLS